MSVFRHTAAIIGHKSKIITLPWLRTSRLSFRVYRCFQILNSQFNSSMSDVLVWFVSTQILLPTSCNYVVIRLHSEFGSVILLGLTIVSATCTVAVILIFPFGALVHSSSIAYLESFKGIRSRRKLAAYRPLKIRIGTLFFLRRFTVLKAISLIIYWTVRSMLIF